MNCDLNNMIIAGKIHQNINNYIQTIINPNMLLLDLANKIEKAFSKEMEELRYL